MGYIVNVGQLRKALARYDRRLPVVVFWGDQFSHALNVSLSEGSPDDDEPPQVVIEA